MSNTCVRTRRGSDGLKLLMIMTVREGRSLKPPEAETTKTEFIFIYSREKTRPDLV